MNVAAVRPRLVWAFDDIAHVDRAAASPKSPSRRALTERELRHVPAPEWEHTGLTHRGGRTLLVGPRGQHKTRALAALLGASVTGGACYGMPTTRHGAVYAVIGEDAPGWQARWFAWRQAEGIADDEELALHTHIEAVNLYTGRGFDDLLADIARVAPIVIGLDPLSDLTTGADENAQKDMGIVRDRLKRLTEGGRSVIVTHHTGYNESRERGSSVLGAMADTVILMQAEDGDIVLTCRKQKNAAPFVPLRLTFDSEALVLRPSGDVTADGTTPLPQRLLHIIAAQPGITGGAVVKKAGARRAAGYQALHALADAGEITSLRTGVGRPTQWFPKGGSQ
jgi:AAA domain